jgi:hypothetical protein
MKLHEIWRKLSLSYWSNLPTFCFSADKANIIKSTKSCGKKCAFHTSVYKFLRMKFRRIAAPQTQVHQRLSRGSDRRVHTEWQWTLSGVNFFMMVKSAQPVVGGGCTALPLPLYLVSTITSKVVWCKLLAERADTLPPVSPLPLYVLYDSGHFSICSNIEKIGLT